MSELATWFASLFLQKRSRLREYGLRFLFRQHGFDEILIENMGGFLTGQAYLWMFWVWEGLSDQELARAGCILASSWPTYSRGQDWPEFCACAWLPGGTRRGCRICGRNFSLIKGDLRTPPHESL